MPDELKLTENILAYKQNIDTYNYSDGKEVWETDEEYRQRVWMEIFGAVYDDIVPLIDYFKNEMDEYYGEDDARKEYLTAFGIWCDLMQLKYLQDYFKKVGA